MFFSRSKVYIYLLALGYLAVQAPGLPAQIRVAPDRYRVEFTDKNHNGHTVGQPQHFLSERALQRRARQGIGITPADLPVSRFYTDSLEKLGMEVLNTSRWFNSATVRCPADEAGKLGGLGFIRKTAPVRTEQAADTASGGEYDWSAVFSLLFRKEDSVSGRGLYAASAEYYGKAADQIGMMNGQALHNRGFRGRGMLIAVIDGGFHKVDELSGFDSLRSGGRLLGIKNFTADRDGGTGGNNHGTNVLSIIAANLPGRLVGSAPDAAYLLLRSEETGSEYMVEEDNWIAAVEYADSAGADLITSSLGYSVFDDAEQNHRCGELDGQSARASAAATMAAARGMIVCVSAGNEGDGPWRRVSVPADADSIVAVGAVGREKQYVSFSSVGPTADGRIKPDLAAMGRETAYQGSSGSIAAGDGTSYSAPLLAGLVACLWQAYPDRGNMEIIDMVKRSADHYQAPDSLYGYGVPDFSELAGLLSSAPAKAATAAVEPYVVSVFPNPATGAFSVYMSPARHGRVNVRVLTVSGKPVYIHTGYVAGYNACELQVCEGADFAPGMYIVETRTEAGRVTIKVIRR